MSNPVKKLAGQTAIYGLGTILPRFLNYLLTPLLTYVFQKPVDYGVNSEMYSYIAFLNVIFTYGMETAFFNFSSKNENKNEVYNTALTSLLCSSVVLCVLMFVFSEQIAIWLQYADKTIYVIWTILIIGTDAIMAIPFAKMRLSNQATRFTLIKTTNVLVNVSLQVFFFVFCKNAFESHSTSILASLYHPEIGIGYSFLSNFIANLISLVLLLPQFKEFRFAFKMELWRKMVSYAWPLLILGLAGMVNETFDRIIIKKLLPLDVGQHAQGVYGACYKISILMTIFIQAFRYAADPFFFNHAKEKNSKQIYADVTKIFVIFCSFLFLGTMMNLPILKYFVSEPYWEGLPVVPILLVANLCLGVYYNLSIWYKLTGQTKYGVSITMVGAIITLAINFGFVEHYSYMACAWATLAAYSSMMVMSYFLGQKQFPIPYNLRTALGFFGMALGFYFLSMLWQNVDSISLKLVLNNLLVAVFLFVFYKFEFLDLKKIKENTL